MKHSRYVGSLLTAGLSMGCLCTAWAAEWTVAEGSSTVGFVGVQQGTKFSGRFEAFTAEISFDPSAPDNGTIIGTVETSSVNTRDHDRDASLLDRDWFDSSNYPEARFESQSIEKLDDGSFKAAGELTLKGHTRPMDLSFTFEMADDSSAKFTGAMKIDRFDFNVGEGWNDTSWVGQDVDVEVNLDLTK